VESDPKARVTAIENAWKGDFLIDKKFDSEGEAYRFYHTLVDSEDSYDEICLWVTDGWRLAERTY
jgi:hypothetical protein